MDASSRAPLDEKIKLVFDRLKEDLTSRRALLITPFAFAGIVVLSSRRSGDADGGLSADGTNQDVTIVPFTDTGVRLAPTQVTTVIHSNSDWRKVLTAEQFYVTRQQGTDTAFTGTYYQSHARGIFRCICCANALFSSDTKFDSGTGWPSFSAPIAEENVHTRTDVSMFLERTEVLCTRCDAHLGHVFNDGPEPAYLRYCINESSLRFVALAATHQVDGNGRGT